VRRQQRSWKQDAKLIYHDIIRLISLYANRTWINMKSRTNDIESKYRVKKSYSQVKQNIELSYLRSLDIDTKILLSFYLFGEIPQVLVAFIVGVKQETVSRSVKRLKKEGKIETIGRKKQLYGSVAKDYKIELSELSALLI